ncbi:hypothetical protein ACFV1N_46780 [Streptosporangium canum]|uniref:hypothetical protein n=1 Tax=Streptosporangium canum TaxID=324952 RepID=UPI0036BB7827
MHPQPSPLVVALSVAPSRTSLVVRRMPLTGRRRRHRQAVILAARLQDALLEHGRKTDAHVLASGRVAVSVARGVLVRTDGVRLWWVIWGARHRPPRLAVYRTPALAAERLMEQLAAARPAPVRLLAGPLLADALLDQALLEQGGKHHVAAPR